MGMINFFIIKILIKVKYANIINIAANDEIIPELLQSKCNPKDIYNLVDKLLNDKESLKKQVLKSQEIIDNFRTGRATEIASDTLFNHL